MAFIQVAHLLSVEKHIEIMRSILLIDTLTDAYYLGMLSTYLHRLL